MNGRRTIIVTGSSGLVGSHLVSYFSELGFQVRALQRNQLASHVQNVQYIPFDLSDVQDNGFAGADCLVHCAYRPVISKQEREADINWDLEGTKKIVALARKHGIKLIFLSTFSAHEDAQSHYAQNKLLIEQFFDTQRDLILRLGIVIGIGGGLIGRIALSLKKHRIIPLIGGGHQRTQTIAVDDLCRIIDVGITKNISGLFKVSHPTTLCVRELYKKVADRIGARCFFISVPSGIVFQIVSVAERLGLKLPFTSQNILGLQDLKTFDTRADLNVFGLELKDCQSALNAITFFPDETSITR